MADLSIEELRREHNERVAKRTSEAVALLNNSFPDMEIDHSRLFVDSFGDVFYRPNNLEYFRINLVYGDAYKRQTDLGCTLSMNEQNGRSYQLFETRAHIVHAERMGDSAFTTFFSKLTGSRSRGKRHIRDIKTSGKGEYLVLDGVRFYFDRAQREHGAGEKPSIIIRLQDNLQTISNKKQEREHAPKRECEPEL